MPLIASGLLLRGFLAAGRSLARARCSGRDNVAGRLSAGGGPAILSQGSHFRSPSFRIRGIAPCCAEFICQLYWSSG
jgi:hypothetical protein